MSLRARLIGIGSYLPERIVTNAEVATRMDTTDDWIVQRTGIRERRCVAPGETTGDMAIAAARAALAQGGIDPQSLDAIILATTTPDRTFPATAVRVQRALERPGIPAFDVQAVCSGFLYGLGVADSMIRSRMARRILLIGADAMTRILDWSDRGTGILFGDGAGAVVLTAEEQPDEALLPRGVLACRLHADGRHQALLEVSDGPGSTQKTGVMRMEGKEVFRHAVTNLAEVVHEVLADAGLTAAEVDWLIPHQANLRILKATAEKLGLPEARMIVTVDQHGNTSAASVPLALDQGLRDGRIREGQVLLLEAMGGGFTWGGALIRY